MGIIVLQTTTVITTENMKLFLVAALLIASACAEPESEGEAKPWLAYGSYGYNYPAYGYSGYAGHYGYAGYPYATHGYRISGNAKPIPSQRPSLMLMPGT